MRQFYEQVRVDAETLRFYARCPICGKKEFGARLPLICRNAGVLAKCAKGRANRFSQKAYNHAKAASTQQLALCFNQCRYCYRWVCDACYNIDDPHGACTDCSKKEH